MSRRTTREVISGLHQADEHQFEAALPEWLWHEQREMTTRVLSALDSFGIALLAEPAGSGKTYIALAAARSRCRGRLTCLAPAAAVPQWNAAARATGISIQVSSHELASRGRLPAPRGLIVIDESHHFRNPATQRYAHVAEWLLGREALLLTASPMVNRMDDLRHQLRLAMSDTAGAIAGMPSLMESFATEEWSAALRRVVLRSAHHQGLPPISRRTVSPPISRATAAALRGVDRLRLSGSLPVAALVRGVFYRAAASSPAALGAALRRYQLLLLNAADAQSSGRTLSRAALRRWVGELETQLVFWPLVADEACDARLITADLSHIAGLRRLCEEAGAGFDPRLLLLEQLLSDGQRTLVFTTFTATLDWLRHRLPLRAAWCSGRAAGIGGIRRPREFVLSLFAEGPTSGAPTALLATDVAAESLNLQGAGRVVHFDLPWTDARLRQREGRSARRGAAHDVTEVVRFELPARLERKLRVLRALEQKAGLAALVQRESERTITPSRRCTSERKGPSQPGYAVVADGEAPGVLARVDVSLSTGATIRRLLWADTDGRVHDDQEHLQAALRRLQSPLLRDQPLASATAGAAVLRSLRHKLSAECHGLRAATLTAAEQMLARRLRALAQQAAARRDVVLARRATAALDLIGRLRTAGSERLAARLADADDEAALRALERIPARPGVRIERVALTHALIFVSGAGLLR